MNALQTPEHRANRYIFDPRWRGMNIKRNITEDRAKNRSMRRSHACEVLQVRRVKVLELNFDNPYIEPHAWKYLVRDYMRRRDQLRGIRRAQCQTKP